MSDKDYFDSDDMPLNPDEGDMAPLSVEIEEQEASPPQSQPDMADIPPLKKEEEAEGSGVSSLPMRLGEQLVESGIITEDQLNVALKEKGRTGKMLGDQLVSLGFVNSSFLQSFLAESSGFEQFDPAVTMVDPEAVEKVPKEVASRFQILPISFDDKKVNIAMADPHDVVVQDKLRQYFPRGVKINPYLCSPKILAESIDNAYGYATSVDAILRELESGEVDLTNIPEDEGYSHPIVRLINALVYDAVKMGASDLHFEPEEQFVRLRVRIDGVLKEVQTFHKDYWNAMAQRMKIISEMNIADKHNPQDGRFNLTVGGRVADFRVSSLPTVHGENFVLRVLDKSTGIMKLEDLGFSKHNMEKIQRVLKRPEGIIIVTGPTGSGKTTSLYSMINAVNDPEVNIMTLEDPVEYSLPLIRQTAVREGTGVSFANGVKALLRQDPDIIFIGEIRDEPTAEQALKASMTGHKVFTTLHTNDSFGAIPRLLDLKLKPGMIAGAVIASFAQRLVRRLCDCKEMKPATAEECEILGVDTTNPPIIGHPKGCLKCENTGYKGRTAVVEILAFDEELDDIVANNGHRSELKAAALKKGFKSMADDGVEKVLAGVTSIEALMKSVNLLDRLR